MKKTKSNYGIMTEWGNTNKKAPMSIDISVSIVDNLRKKVFAFCVSHTYWGRIEYLLGINIFGLFIYFMIVI